MLEKLESLKTASTGPDRHYFLKAWAIRAVSLDERVQHEVAKVVKLYLGDTMFMTKMTESNPNVLSVSLLVESLVLSRSGPGVLEFLELYIDQEGVEEVKEEIDRHIGLRLFYRKQLLYCIQNVKDIRSKYKVNKKIRDLQVRIRLMGKIYHDSPEKLKTIQFLSMKEQRTLEDTQHQESAFKTEMSQSIFASQTPTISGKNTVKKLILD